MQLIIKMYDEKLVKLSKKYFLDNFDSEESMVARYLLCKAIEKEKNIELTIKEKHLFLEYSNGVNGAKIGGSAYFWSISHKNKLVFVGFSDSKIGLDIEIIKDRDISVLNMFKDEEYEILGGKDMESFYRLWTSIESLVKYNGDENLIEGKYKLDSYRENKIAFSGVTFDYELMFKNGKKMYKIFSWKKDNMIYSICFK